MNPAIESALRLVNLTASGLLAGSLGFSDAVLVPGAEGERPSHDRSAASKAVKYFNSIGPIALATSMALAVGSRDRSGAGRALDAASALGLAGVVGTTILVTVPLNRKLEDNHPPADYYDESSHSITKNWSRAHTVRTALGIGAFVCAAAANVLRRRRS